ncbi:MAG: hypothetical protein M0Q01_05585, partial [Syntrophales bacterium]|nr:hypothetical protein [Syntrophales bacterium]
TPWPLILRPIARIRKHIRPSIKSKKVSDHEINKGPISAFPSKFKALSEWIRLGIYATSNPTGKRARRLEYVVGAT